ncbi:MAG: glycosyltransferase [Blastocatellia bacterium]
MRLACFTPLPPAKSGIADYSAELLPYLCRGAEVAVFVEQAAELRANQGKHPYEVHDALHFAEIDRQRPFDLCIYQQGNNPYHEYIYDRALRRPGLLVLHEHCQHHLIAWKTLGRDDHAAYHDELLHAYGRLGARLAGMREAAVGSDYQQFVLPLNRRLMEQSLGVIVHNEFAASMLETPSDGSARPVLVIPHHLSPDVYEMDALAAAECRRRLGLPEDAWIVASFGFVTQAKRLTSLLRAFRRLRAIDPRAYCLIVGEDHSRHPITPLITELGLRDCARITGYVSEKQFFQYLKAVDVVVNLRYPTAGETSGTVTRALGTGKPVIVSDYGQFGDLPDDICLKVEPGRDEEKQLYAQLRRLAYQPLLRERLARRAREYARAEWDIARVAAGYLRFAEQLARTAADETRRIAEMGINRERAATAAATITPEPAEALDYVAGFFTGDPDASGYLRLHGPRILETLRLIPKGTGRERLLELSSYLHMTPLIRRDGAYADIAITGWWDSADREITQTIRHARTGEALSFPMKNVDAEKDRFPWPDGHFDVALCCEIIEHLTQDPVHMLLELNRVLKWGGLLILTTPNIASAFSIGKALSGNSPYVYGEYNLKSRADRHSREYTPNDVRIVMESAGFKVEQLFTKDLWCRTDQPFVDWLSRTTSVPATLRGDNIFAVGRKMSAVFERYPDGIYD